MNEAAATLFGRSPNEMAGVPILDLFEPTASIEPTLQALGTGAVELVRSDRRLRVAGGETIDVAMWSRAVKYGDTWGSISLPLPCTQFEEYAELVAQVAEEVPAAIGVMDAERRVRALSSDIRRLSGFDPPDLLGRFLRDFVHPDDVGVVDPASDRNTALPSHIRLRRRSGGWVEITLLHGAFGAETVAFALLATGPPLVSGSVRAAQLEVRLRRIGAEVRAAGVLDGVPGLPDAAEFPQLSQLTGREWEILSRLLNGQRVPAIADDLFVSQSTARNHLSAIFRKFGVHSQAQLLDLLRPHVPIE